MFCLPDVEEILDDEDEDDYDEDEEDEGIISARQLLGQGGEEQLCRKSHLLLSFQTFYNI